MLYNLIILQAYIIMIILNLIKHKLDLILGWILHCFQNKKDHFLSGLIFNYDISKIASEGYNKHHFVFTGLRFQYFFGKK